MKARPILFSAPMVRALLAGTKTQTRRIVKLPTKTYSGGPIYERPDMGGWEPTTHGGGGCFTIGKDGQRLAAPEEAALWHRTTGICIGSPYGVPGDLLWARESFRKLENASEHPSEPIWFMADGEPDHGHWTGGKPSIHMPRCASRLTLEITDVRVQRLNAITEEDALAEGVVPDPIKGFWVPGVEHPNKDFPWLSRVTAREMYAALWDTINGSGEWLGNPWVWVVTFDVHRQNINTFRSRL